MSLKSKSLVKSPWVFQAASGSCSGCDAEALGLTAPFFDVERMGVVFVSSVRHADIIFVTGAFTKKAASRLKQLYEQAQKPCFVVAIGACACGQGVFKGGYNTPLVVNKIIPVDVYVPGCPPKPEAMIQGVAKAMEKLKGNPPRQHDTAGRSG